MYSIYASVLPSEVFPEWRKGTCKRYLSMRVGLELVKATKYCCQNPFCSVTQPKTGLQVTLNTYINVWRHGDYIEIFTFRYTGGSLRLSLIFHVSSWHNSDISFLKCQLYIGDNCTDFSCKKKERDCSIKGLKKLYNSEKKCIDNTPDTDKKYIVFLCLFFVFLWDFKFKIHKFEKIPLDSFISPVVFYQLIRGQ